MKTILSPNDGALYLAAATHPRHIRSVSRPFEGTHAGISKGEGGRGVETVGVALHGQLCPWTHEGDAVADLLARGDSGAGLCRSSSRILSTMATAGDLRNLSVL